MTGKVFEGKKLIINNSLWLLAERLTIMAGNLLLSVFFARMLGPEAYGQLNYVTAFVALFLPLYALGMLNLMMREFNRAPPAIPDIIRTCVTSRLVAGLLIVGLTLPLLYWGFGGSWKFSLLAILLLANVSNAFEIYDYWFKYQSNNAVVVKWRLGIFGFFTLVKLLLIWHFRQIEPLIYTLAIELLVMNIGYRYWYYRVAKPQRRGQFSGRWFKSIFGQSKFLILSSLAGVVYLKIDILMLEAMTTDQVVGIYSVAAKLSEVWYVLPTVALTALFPKLLKIANKDQQQYQQILQHGFDLLFISALAISVVMYVISPYLVSGLFGSSYDAAVAILRIHIFASVFIFMRLLLSQWLVSESFAQFSLFSQLLGAVSNILLNYWLIPAHGAIGAAIATVISYFIATYVCLFFHYRTRVIAVMMTKSMGFLLRMRQVWQIIDVYRHTR